MSMSVACSGRQWRSVALSVAFSVVLSRVVLRLALICYTIAYGGLCLDSASTDLNPMTPNEGRDPSLGGYDSSI